MTTHRRFLPVMLVLAVLALGAAAASGGQRTTAAGSPITVGTIMSTSGFIAVQGLQEKNAIELAVKEANRAGGINGRKLKWIVYDPAADTAQCVSLTRRLLDNDKVDVVVGGGASSGCALAMEQILTPRGMFFSSGEADPSITDPVSKNPTTFQFSATSAIVAERLMQYAKAKGVKTIAVLGDTGAFGQSGITAFQDLAGKYGMTVKGTAYSASTTDLTPQLKDFASANPGAYVIWTATPTGVTALKNAHALGLDSKAIVMTAHSYGSPALMRQAGDAGKGVVVPVVNATVYKQVLKSMSPVQRKTLLAFSKLYNARYKQDISIYSAQAYDAANATFRALRLTKGDTDGKKMTAALEKAGSFVGTMGTFHYSQTSHYGLPASDLRIAKWSGSGWVLQK